MEQIEVLMEKGEDWHEEIVSLFETTSRLELELELAVRLRH